MLDITFAAHDSKRGLGKYGAIAVLAGEDGVGDAVASLDLATTGAVSRAVAAAEFKGKANSTCVVLGPNDNISRVVVIGLGKIDEVVARTAEDAGGLAAAALAKAESAALDARAITPALGASAALGAVLRAYRFDRYRSMEKPEDKPKLAKLTVLVDDVAAAKAAWTHCAAVADGVFLARDLVSEPPNVLTPVEMARRCAVLADLGVKIEVLGQPELEKLKFGCLLGVSQGSAEPPRVVIMHWNGASGGDAGGGKSAKGKGKKNAAPATQPIAFVGKGVTFDTGGISIKPAAGMEDMKFDMGGAAAVIGLMAALAGRKAKVDVIGLVGLVENMPSGTAQRPGDVVTSYSGQTVEIINTDAEGRLVLADVLYYCQQKYDPRFMVDLATLTGAMIVSLGHEYGGMFANDEELASRLLAAGETTGEKLWRMPLHESYDKMIKSDIADMKNVGGRPGGASSAACFIQRFVNKKPWAHLDIAGMAWATRDGATVPKGATAYGVRLLDRFVADHYES